MDTLGNNVSSLFIYLFVIIILLATQLEPTTSWLQQWATFHCVMGSCHEYCVCQGISDRRMSWDWAHEDVYWLVLPKWLCRTSYLKNGTPWFSQSVNWWDIPGIHIVFALTLKAPSCGKLGPFTKMEKVTYHFLFIPENACFLTNSFTESIILWFPPPVKP